MILAFHLIVVLFINKDTFALTLNANNQYTKWFWTYDVEFWLYTRNNNENYQVLKTNDSSSIRESNFDFNKKLKVFAHGWISSGHSYTTKLIKDAYLKALDVNVIVVNWNREADRNYIISSYKMPSVGGILTDFLEFLVREGFYTRNMHLIGHSLGAHVVGLAGLYYRQQNRPIQTITGLDPAYPFFKFSNEESRLDKSDAHHVQVIHTCSGFLGFPDALGHIDYYLNSDSCYQPGCGYDFIGTCAHERAVEYFAESIEARVSFIAVECESYNALRTMKYCNGTDSRRILMNGLESDNGKEGVYYIETNSTSPYALGDPDNWNRN